MFGHPCTGTAFWKATAILGRQRDLLQVRAEKLLAAETLGEVCIRPLRQQRAPAS
ncbi:MAG: hypothetical protein R3F45_06650 [Gammaproteobacteria bacterium]